MSYRKFEKVTIEEKIVMVCDDCEMQMSVAYYTIMPTIESDNLQNVHLCSSRCFKRFITRWGGLFNDGNGARAMFVEIPQKD